MRRALASLLLALFSLPLIFATLVDGAVSSLPACCLRDGKHHCVLADPVESPASPQLQSVQPKCPMFPRAGALPGFSQSAALASAAATVVIRIERAAAPPATDRAVSQLSFLSPHKRGPPSQLLYAS